MVRATRLAVWFFLTGFFMAKIRSIKPEFWESEQVGECQPMARLLFICLWNFCDDAGNYPASVKAMKRNAFGYDEVSADQVAAWMDELISNGLVAVYEVDGRCFWHVTGFSKHQTIARPFYKYPPFPDVPSPENDEFLPEQCSSNVQALPEQCSSNVQALRERETVREMERERERERETRITPVDAVSTPTVKPPDTVVGLLVQSGVCRNPHDPRVRKLVDNQVAPSVVADAIETARLKGKLSLGYVIGIIEGWQRDADGMRAGPSARMPRKVKSTREQLAEYHAIKAEQKKVIDGQVKEVEGGHVTG